MIAKKATKPGRCKCEFEYGEQTLLLLSDDGKTLLGCEKCPSDAVQAKLLRVTRPNAPWRSHTGPKKYRCDACGGWHDPGGYRLPISVQGREYPLICGCSNCPDLTPAEKVRATASLSEEDRRKIADKEAALAARRFTDEEAKDPAARRARMGNWSRALDVLRQDWQVLGEIAAKRQINLDRLASAFEVRCFESPALAACAETTLVNAFRTAVELGVYPGKGPTALAYLIPMGDEATLRPGYKLWADLILNLPGVMSLQTGIVWRCEEILGLRAAAYHKAKRAAMAAIKQGKPQAIQTAQAMLQIAEAETQRRGAEMLDKLQRRDLTAETPKEAAENRALCAALALTDETAGMNWWEWEWFRYVGGGERLAFLDIPSPGIWQRPAMCNALGVVPSAAFAMVHRRGADNVVRLVDAKTVMLIAVKGKNARLNDKGGLDGDVWGDDQSAPHMWAKTALIQVATHGELPLRQADPERVTILERIDEGATTSDDVQAAVSLYTSIGDLAVARAAEIRGRARPAAVRGPTVERPALPDHGEPEEPFEWPEEDREPVPILVGEARTEAPAAASASAAAPTSDDVPSAEDLAALETNVGPEYVAAARAKLRLSAGANLARLSAEDRSAYARALEANLPPDERRW